MAYDALGKPSSIGTHTTPTKRLKRDLAGAQGNEDNWIVVATSDLEAVLESLDYFMSLPHVSVYTQLQERAEKAEAALGQHLRQESELVEADWKDIDTPKGGIMRAHMPSYDAGWQDGAEEFGA